MMTFLAIFALSIVALLAVQAMDVENVRPRTRRRGYGFARKIRMPFGLSSRGMLEGKAR